MCDPIPPEVPTATFLMQSKHGVSIDIRDSNKRTHVRLFEYVVGEDPSGGEMELPSPLNMDRFGHVLLSLATHAMMNQIPEIKLGEPVTITLK